MKHPPLASVDAYEATFAMFARRGTYATARAFRLRPEVCRAIERLGWAA